MTARLTEDEIAEIERRDADELGPTGQSDAVFTASRSQMDRRRLIQHIRSTPAADAALRNAVAGLLHNIDSIEYRDSAGLRLSDATPYVLTVRQALTARAAPEWRVPEGWQLVPKEPTEEMLAAALEESGQRISAYTAPRESGVALDGDITEAEAVQFNAEFMAAHGDNYRAMLTAAPLPAPPAARTEGEG